MRTVLYPVNELKVGGAEQQLLELVRGLDKHRFRPIVAPLYPGGALEPELRAIEGVELVQLNRRGKYDPSTLLRMAACLRDFGVDVIQPFLTPSTFFGLLPALVVGTPVKVVTERCGVRAGRHVGYKVYRTAEDYFTRFADAVVANSEAGRDLLRARGVPGEKVKVIYNGLNLDRLATSPDGVNKCRDQLHVPEGGHVVGILASLTPAKDHETLFRAVARVSERRPGIRCAVIGDGPLRTDLEWRAAELGIDDRTRFFGNQRQIGDFLAACDVLVSSSCDNEGCSNSILEAMALGVPVIATDVGGNRELVEPGLTGYLIPSRDDHALAAALDRSLGDPSERQSIAAQARAMVDERFGLTRMVTEYEDLYETLLSRKRSAHGSRQRRSEAPIARRGLVGSRHAH